MRRFSCALWQIVRFELLWKLAVLCLFNPLFREIYQSHVSYQGLRFNDRLVWTLLDLKSGVLFLLLFAGAALLVFYEFSVAVNITALCRRGESFSLRQVMKSSLWNLGVMRGWSLAAGSVYYVLLLPLVNVGYSSTMVPQVSIPWFIFGEMIKTPLGTAGVLLIYMIYLGLWLLLAFVPVCMILRHQTFWQAARSSPRCWRALGWRRLLGTLVLLAAMQQGLVELARFWRRSRLGNEDFDASFLQYLVSSEAFQKDLLWWLLLTVLSVVLLALFLWVFLGNLEQSGPAEASLQPPWSPDSQALLDIAGRWLHRNSKLCRAGAAAVCLILVVNCILRIQPALLVHAPLAIGHRGSGYHVENTLEAIQNAQHYGLDYAEIDVQLTKDGVPVLFHDGTLARLSGRPESVGELTWAELQDIPLRDEQLGLTASPASLEEAIQALAGSSTGLLIELKPADGNGTALSQAVMELVERYEFGDQAMVMSLNYLCLLPILERHPDWWVGYCAFGMSGDLDDAVWRYQVDFLAVEEVLVSNRLTNQAREVGLPIYVWSVYDTEKMQQYLEMGVTGLVSDYPDSLAEVLSDYRASHASEEYVWEGPGVPKL